MNDDPRASNEAPNRIVTETGQTELQSSQDEDAINSNARHALDQLVASALAYRTSGELRALFEFMRRFPHLAPFNAMLLHVQNPGIGFALTAYYWWKLYDRRVRPGARPYVILWTMGPVAFVFDLSDTEPRDPANDHIPEAVSNPFPAKGEPPPGALGKLESACTKLRIQIERRDFGTQLAGSVRWHTSPGWDFLVQLNSKHNEARLIATLAHELGHVFCGHLGTADGGFWPKRTDLGKASEELEAEAVAWLVTERLNLEIGSASYLSRFLISDQKLPSYSLDAVLKAAGKLEDMVKGRFRIKSTP